MTERTRGVIAAYVKDHPGQGPAQISTGTGLPRELVKKTVRRMVGDSKLRADGKGHYYAGSRRTLSLVTVPASVPAEDTEQGDTTAGVASGDTAGSWRCSCCHWLQAVATVQACEFCGAPSDWGKPR
jgi:hypothetical protein